MYAFHLTTSIIFLVGSILQFVAAQISEDNRTMFVVLFIVEGLLAIWGFGTLPH